jgi:Ca2+-binding EF-hand superfamily protein
MKASTLLILSAGLAAGGFLGAADARACEGTPDASFEGMDLDHDGRIGASEHAAATRRMFATMDSNADGKVTVAEMDKAHQQVTGQKAKRGDMASTEKIRTIDQNGDRALSAAEHDAGSAMMFAAMDGNKDGRLSRAEFDKGHAALGKPRVASSAGPGGH